MLSNLCIIALLMLLANASSLQPHLYVLSHGFMGSSSDLSYLSEQIQSQSTASVSMHLSNCNSSPLNTLDGIAAGGTRLFEEIVSVVNTVKPDKLSLVGNSLGGLYVRYAAKLLVEAHGSGDGSLTIGGHTIMLDTLMTTASPHLGIADYRLGPFSKLPRYVVELADNLQVGQTIRDL